MKNDKIIRNNFEYFKTHLLNRYFIFKLGENNIVVKVDKQNFSHLIGIKYSSKGRYYMFRSEQIYNVLDTTSEIDNLTDLIDEDRLNYGELNESEKFFVDKNSCFEYLFDSLIKYNNYELILYKKDATASFDADYLYCEIVDEFETKGYIGLIGEEKTNYYRFNSVYKDDKKIITGVKRKVDNFSIIEQDSFNEKDFMFMPSPRNVNNIKLKRKVAKTGSFKIDNKIVNYINKELDHQYKLIKGNGKAKQYNLTKNKEILIKDFQEEPFEKSVEGIIKYINKKYPLSKKSKSNK